MHDMIILMVSPMLFLVCMMTGFLLMQHRMRRQIGPDSAIGREELTDRAFFEKVFSYRRNLAPLLWAERLFLLLNTALMAVGGWLIYQRELAHYQEYADLGYSWVHDPAAEARESLALYGAIPLFLEVAAVGLLVLAFFSRRSSTRRLQQQLDQLERTDMLGRLRWDFSGDELQRIPTGDVRGDVLVGGQGVYRLNDAQILPYSGMEYVALETSQMGRNRWYQIYIQIRNAKTPGILQFTRVKRRDEAYNSILDGIAAAGDPNNILEVSAPRQE